MGLEEKFHFCVCILVADKQLMKHVQVRYIYFFKKEALMDVNSGACLFFGSS